MLAGLRLQSKRYRKTAFRGMLELHLRLVGEAFGTE